MAEQKRGFEESRSREKRLEKGDPGHKKTVTAKNLTQNSFLQADSDQILLKVPGS
jgi:hypothetical protein